MKVLAISLLRLGDILMLAPVLKGLKEQNENVVLHVLINKQFGFVSSLFPWVDKFILLDRIELQKGLGEAHRQIFESMDRLDAIINFLNKEEYTKVVNLTHTKFSGFLCGMIKAEEKLGMNINENLNVSFGNRWYTYLNEQVAGGSEMTAHMIDVHYYGSCLPYRTHHFDFYLDKNGEEESTSLLGEMDNYICVQPFTSDLKKDWGFQKIAETLKFFTFMNPQIKILALAAPNESFRLAEFIDICKNHSVSVIPAVCSLQGALGLLTRAKLLLTGDTSIKHLACGTDCKIVEICLGSSDFRRTGAYKENSFIVTSLESCAPCSHSANCSKSSHLCGESINVEAVGLLMHQILNGGSKEIKILAKEYSDSLKIYKTFFNHSGFWFARDLAKGFDSEDLEQVINLSSWKLLNQGEHLKLIGEYGSEGVKLNAAIHQAFPEIQNSIKQRFFSDLESRTTQDGENLLRIRGQLQNLLKNQDFNNKEIVRNFKLLQEELSPKLAEEILQFISNFSGNPSIHFTKIRKFTEAMQSAFNRNQIQLKLIRTMMNQRMVGL